MKIDEAAQAQLNYFADSFRRAMAARTTIVICAGTNHDDKCEEVACGVASPRLPGESKEKAMVDPVTLLLATTNALLHKVSGGECKIMVSTPAGMFDVPSSKSDETTFNFQSGG